MQLVIDPTVLIVGAVSLGSAALVNSHLTAEELSEPTRKQISRMSSQLDLPLVLPMDLPGEYRWADEIAVSSDAQTPGHTISRTVMFYDFDAERSIRVCIARSEDDCEIPPTGHSEQLSVGDLVISLVFPPSVPESDQEAWAAVTFTQDFDRVTWLS